MRKVQKLIILLILTIGLISCGDNGTGSVDEEPPSLPNLEYSQPDVSYFQNTNPKAKSSSPNYIMARSLVLGFSGFSNIGQIYSGFIESAPENDASFSDGIWEWTYSYNYGGFSSEMRLTAEEAGNAINWVLFWSFDDGQGTNVQDYKLMEGTTQNDGLSGEWVFNTLNPDTNTPVPVLESSWLTDGESESTIEVTVFDGNSSEEEVTLNFDQNNNEFLLTITYADTAEDNVEIFWNPESEIGYILQDGEQLCWDSSGTTVEDVSCSEVGL